MEAGLACPVAVTRQGHASRIVYSSTTYRKGVVPACATATGTQGYGAEASAESLNDSRGVIDEMILEMIPMAPRQQ